MKRVLAIAVSVIMLAAIASSIAQCEQSGEVWLTNFLLLRIRCAAGGCSAVQRADAIQQRANDLLALGKGIPKVTVKKSGADANIYTNKTLFMTVTAADGKTAKTTSVKLANIWAQRLRTILPQATPEKH